MDFALGLGLYDWVVRETVSMDLYTYVTKGKRSISTISYIVLSYTVQYLKVVLDLVDEQLQKH